MTPHDMFKELPKTLGRIADKDVKELWPQARGELLAFADHLSKKGMTLTALQMRMVLALAEEAVALRFGTTSSPPGEAPDIVWENPNG